jgi:hypothetical protein
MLKPEHASAASTNETSLRALVLIPGSVNYFYNAAGRRTGEALREIGFSVEIATLGQHSSRSYNFCLVSSLAEVIHSCGNEVVAHAALRDLQKSCGLIAALSIDCAATVWFHNTQKQCRSLKIPAILDLSLHDQRENLRSKDRADYYFFPAGLTSSEMRQVCQDVDDTGRAIPWAFIGHFTPARLALLDDLVRHLDPRGFVYMPMCAPYQEKGSPHLNEHQFNTVLARTRYQIWSSHHSAFYMESERFRMSLLAGGVPIKVLTTALPAPGCPFSYLMMEASALPSSIRRFDFALLRQQFRKEYLEIKPLSKGLADFLYCKGILPSVQPARTQKGDARLVA